MTSPRAARSAFARELRVFGASAGITCRLMARHPLPWGILLATAALLGFTRGLAIRQPLEGRFLLELTASGLLVLSWLSALILLPFLYQRTSGYWSQIRDHRLPVSAVPIVSGIAAGGALALALLGATFTVLVFGLQAYRGLAPFSAAIPSFASGWTGGVSLFFLALLLSRWMARPTILCITLVVVLIDLTPSLLYGLPSWLPVDWLFLPVSPSELFSDQASRWGVLRQTLLWNGLYCLGLGLLLPGTWGSRSPL